MTLTTRLDAICKKLNIGTLPDRLLTTYLDAIAKHYGVDTAKLPDSLVSTYLTAIAKARGVDTLCDNLLTTQLEALAMSCGASKLPDGTLGAYLDAIIGGLDSGVQVVRFTVTGDEAFTFSASSKAAYFMNSAMANVERAAITAECTHFTFGSGNVLADMKDGEFIFNVTAATGLTTGNVSFKKDSVFADKTSAAAWFKAQYENGTPVIVTAYIRKG